MTKMIIEKGSEVKKYYAGSQRLSHTIRTTLNMQPIEVYKNKRGKIINVFVMTNELSAFLIEWTKNRPEKGSEIADG